MYQLRSGLTFLEMCQKALLFFALGLFVGAMAQLIMPKILSPTLVRDILDIPVYPRPNSFIFLLELTPMFLAGSVFGWILSIASKPHYIINTAFATLGSLLFVFFMSFNMSRLFGFNEFYFEHPWIWSYLAGFTFTLLLFSAVSNAETIKTKGVATLCVLLACISIYLIASYVYLSRDYKRPIDAYASVEGIRLLPRFIPKAYLMLTNYKNRYIEGNKESLHRFLFTLYASKRYSKSRLIELSAGYLKNGADINEVNHHGTILHGAVSSRDVKLIEHALSFGADKEIKTHIYKNYRCTDMTSLELAKCLHALGRHDYTNIISLL